MVTVITYNARDEALFQGTGFFITPGGSFLTNCHVLAQAARAEVEDRPRADAIRSKGWWQRIAAGTW